MSDKYLKVGDDWDGLTDKYSSGGDRLTFGLKLVGKSLFNVGVFAVTEAVPGIISQAGNRAETVLDKHRDQLSEEQVAALEKGVANRDAIEQQRAAHMSIPAERADFGAPVETPPATRSDWDIKFEITSREKRMRDNPDDEECQKRDSEAIERLRHELAAYYEAQGSQ
jgi:hypothetical protein